MKIEFGHDVIMLCSSVHRKAGQTLFPSNVLSKDRQLGWGGKLILHIHGHACSDADSNSLLMIARLNKVTNFGNNIASGENGSSIRNLVNGSSIQNQ